MILERGPSSGSGRRRGLHALSSLGAALLSTLVLAGGSPGPALAGVEEEDIASQIAGYRKILDEGSSHLSSLDFPEAADAFTKLIDAYKAGKIPMVTPDAHLIVARSYEGRALSFGNQAKNAEASADFEALIRFDPNYAVELKGVSQKIVTLYLAVRKKILGIVTIEGDPIGSEAKLGDKPMGLTPVTDKDWIAGSYHLLISHQGYDPYEEEVKVDAGAKLARKFRLIPNSRSVQIATVPRDVKVLVDGKERGATFGTAGPVYDEVARELGVSRADISEPLLVEYLKPGNHDVLLKKECFEEVTAPLSIEIDANNNLPIAYKPFVLKPSRGTIQIASEPSGAQILLDGKVVGTTPATLPDVCAGKHDLLLTKEGRGRSSAAVEVRNAETLKIDEKLKLSLAAIDLRTGLQDGEGLVPALKGLTRYNLISPGRGIPVEVADRVRLEMESSQGKGLSEKTLHDLFEGLKVELVALTVPTGALGDQIEFQLYCPMHVVPDRWQVSTAGSEGLRKILFALDAGLPVESAWLGLKLIDVSGKGHPVVLAVTMGSPAAISGVLKGEVLVSVGGAPIQKVSDVGPVLRKATPGEDTTLTLEAAGKTREAKLKYLATPLLLQLRDPSLLYNKVIADLSQVAATSSDRLKGAYAWMNIGVALMHFGRYEDAVRDAFKRADLPDGAGVSKGTVRYLTAVCYEKLGLQSDARAAYLEASTSPTATLESHDGPLIAPSAKRRATALSMSSKP